MNTQLNKQDKAYKNGWDDGFQIGYHQHKKELMEKIEKMSFEIFAGWNRTERVVDLDQIKSIIEKV